MDGGPTQSVTGRSFAVSGNKHDGTKLFTSRICAVFDVTASAFQSVGCGVIEQAKWFEPQRIRPDGLERDYSCRACTEMFHSGLLTLAMVSDKRASIDAAISPHHSACPTTLITAE
jgi:hypothetical protein